MLNKIRLINDLKELHKEIVIVYKNIFDYKYINDPYFVNLITEEYKKENISAEDKKESWNIQYFHRSAYTLLNKILFIRICEDKGFMLNDEDKIMDQEINTNAGQKLSMLGLQKWTSLISNYSLSELIRFAFKDMNRSYYNITLYKEDKYDWLIPNKKDVELLFGDEDSNSKKLFYDFESLIKNIIEVLDTSRYNFGDSSDNVLGDVYENFMDRDTRKALGQFYTPDFVIEYILENTVKNVDIISNPFVKVLDPSCGSGHFLTMAYDLLREKFEENIDRLREKYKSEIYEISVGDNKFNIKGIDYWSKKYLHYHLLKHCIYGADIDGFALQITTINLLLKDLDNFITDELNIIECDSLIKWERDYEWLSLKEQLETGDLLLEVKHRNILGVKETLTPSFEEAYEIVNKGAFWSNEFDYIVGNPPYITVGGKYTELLEDIYEGYLSTNYKFSDYKMNTYILFMERGMDVLKENGSLSYITPRAVLDNYYFKNIRKFILDNLKINSLIEINSKVFDMAETGGNAIFVLEKQSLEYNYEIDVAKVNNNDELQNLNFTKLSQSNFLNNNNYNFTIGSSSSYEIISKIKQNTVPLGDIFEIKNGVNTGNAANVLLSDNKLDDRYLPIIEGKDIQRFNVNWGGLFICYDKDIREKIDLKSLKTKQKKIDFALRTIDIFSREKIVVRQTGDKLISAIENQKYITRHSVHLMYPKEESSIKSQKYITCLLNSILMNFYYQTVIPEKKKAFAEVKIVNLEYLPIRKISTDKIQLFEILYDKLFEGYSKLEQFKEESIEIFMKNDFMEIKKYLDKKGELLGEISLLTTEINKNIFDIYEMDLDEIKSIYKLSDMEMSKEEEIIYSSNGAVGKSEILSKTINEIKKILDPESFINEHVNNNLSLTDMSKKYNSHLITINYLRENYSSENAKEEPWIFYNFSEVYETIDTKIRKKALNLLREEMEYTSLTKLSEKLLEINPELIVAMENYKKDFPVKKQKEIIKKAINDQASTWSSFVKNKGKNKQFVKYDTNIYGLSDWEDEVHKRYFIDLVNYYTSKNEANFVGTIFEGLSKTKKKAEAALKSLKELVFKDKEEYLEVLTEKVRKAFD
ncbi:Eco57I restriction-modification methylase domain-containing protein [Ureibacillus sp. MALMAid1270]|uniref:Eco57I restriction-modification methylase domain-containing protein n=1 Tax=Ureibacillus sp. MALMAid1270 TaxID=3411629 RepID=UPI003BA48316